MKWLSLRTKYTLAAIALVCYLGSITLGFAHMLEMADMNMAMSDCPFSQLQNSTCFVSVSNQVKGFQKMVLGMQGLSLIRLVLLETSAILLSFYVVSVLPRYILYARRNMYERRLVFLELFSDGILNPKVF